MSNIKYQINTNANKPNYLKFEIGNLKFEIPTSEAGFTLIELLVTIMVLMAVGVIIGSILSSSLRGAATVSTINSVRQNGNYAISQMAKMIRFSQKFEGVSATENGPYTCNSTPWCTPCSADINKNDRVSTTDYGIVTTCRKNGISGTHGTGQSCSQADINQDGTVDETDSSCVQSQLNKSCTTSTSGEKPGKFLKITGFDGGVTTFACQNDTIASKSASGVISLTDPEVSVPLVSCSFTCVQGSAASAPTIGIEFILQKKQQQDAVGFFENQTSIPFKTSVSPRNLY